MTDSPDHPPDHPPDRRPPGWAWLFVVVCVSLLLWAAIVWGGTSLYR